MRGWVLVAIAAVMLLSSCDDKVKVKIKIGTLDASVRPAKMIETKTATRAASPVTR